MKTTFSLFLAAACLAPGPALAAQEASSPPENEAPKPTVSQDELEARFKTLLSNVTLTGRWAPIRDGVLGQEKEEKYTIVSVARYDGDVWVVNAKMKYGGREIVAPIPVRLKWAGETPVIVVDDLKVPGGNRSYSARVLFFRNTYAGSWTGGEHGGVLSGIIVKADKE